MLRIERIITVWALLILLVLCSGCAASRNYYRDDFFGRDKLYHFTAAGIIGAGSTTVAKNNGFSNSNAPVIGISVAVGAGAGKEVYDVTVKDTYWNWKDMFWGVIGGAVGSYAVANID